MPKTQNLTRFILLPEINFLSSRKAGKAHTVIEGEKVSAVEICPKCATPSTVIYDRRQVEIKDAPIRGVSVKLKIIKRRFYCKICKKPFTEPLPGIGKRHRTTHRYRREVLWAAENFSNLAQVRKAFRCSTAFLYKILYEQLELRVSKNINYPWPKSLGIDEHFFKRTRDKKRVREFVTVFTDHKGRRLREMAHGKSAAELELQVGHIEGRENVEKVTLDLSDSYKSFIKNFFPNAEMIADKFHVLRLLNPHINRRRKEITGDNRKNPVRKLLLRNGKDLEYFEKKTLYLWLDQHPELKEVYHFKEALHGLYRVKGIRRAKKAFASLTDRMALSNLPEIKTLRKTLLKWQREFLNYFIYKLTNARTEGFNNGSSLLVVGNAALK
jgi:transposase